MLHLQTFAIFILVIHINFPFLSQSQIRSQMFSQLFFILLLSIYCITSNYDFADAANSEKCLEDQKMLLLQFRNNLTYDSEASMKLSKWDDKTDCCQWEGVSCNDAGQVIGLDLSYEWFSGSINNSALANLNFLSVIVLDGNNISAPIPEFFADFSNLTVLSLTLCKLIGEAPQRIFQVPTLQIIDLSQNQKLGGSFPEFPSNASLEIMALSFTNFSGNLPKSIGNLRKLIHLDLWGCNFTGPVPSSIENLIQITYLDFSQNGFTGSVPSFRQSKNLSVIRFHENHFSGELLSDQWVGLENLIGLVLSENSLSGLIPESLFSLPSLQVLDLSSNKFAGQITGLQNVTSRLRKLYLAGNNLEGPIPDFFFELHGLQELSLSYNKFNGTVQLKKFAKFENLTALDLSHNRLSVDTSTSESTVVLLSHLSILNLGSCDLYNISFLENQSELLTLDLSNNHLGGEIPNWIWEINEGGLSYVNLSRNQFTHLQEPYRFHNIDVLDLHSNLLTGEIPLPPPTVSYVDFSSNNFTSVIPADFGHLSTAVFLSISNNTIGGTIPYSICNATNLEVLDLSSNNLSGRIPACLAEQSGSLKVLNLGGNNLRGSMPGNFSEDCGLETIDLRHNHLEGKIPRSLSNCRNLTVLNLGNNKITDTFPCWLKSFSNLRVLVLRFNNFHGTIGCSEVNNIWPALQIIDLASNNFSGVLPKNTFLELKAMMVDSVEANGGPDYVHFRSQSVPSVYYMDTITLSLKGQELTIGKILFTFNSIDFSNNSFLGGIPEFGDIKWLYLLNLSHNALTGRIPYTVGNLKQLGSLDLSFNKLGGHIPEKLSDLTFISFLNLSYNELVGMIPQRNQMYTFTESSFIGNKGLCGFQLNKACNNNDRVAQDPAISEDHEQYFTRTDIYAGAALGFAVAITVIFLPLLFSKAWRECYNKLVDGLVLWLISKVYVKKEKTSTSISEIYWKKKAVNSHSQVSS